MKDKILAYVLENTFRENMESYSTHEIAFAMRLSDSTVFQYLTELANEGKITCLGMSNTAGRFNPSAVEWIENLKEPEQAEKAVLYKTIITVEVLSTEPYQFAGLDELVSDIREGDFSGLTSVSPSVVVEEVDGECKRHGTNPEFFFASDWI